jgi:hypothetical protein
LGEIAAAALSRAPRATTGAPKPLPGPACGRGRGSRVKSDFELMGRNAQRGFATAHLTSSMMLANSTSMSSRIVSTKRSGRGSPMSSGASADFFGHVCGVGMGAVQYSCVRARAANPVCVMWFLPKWHSERRHHGPHSGSSPSGQTNPNAARSHPITCAEGRLAV